MLQKDYKTDFIRDDSTGQVHIKHTQRTDHIMETNKELRGQAQKGKDMKLAARIPLNIIYAWEQEGIKMELVGIDPDITARFWKKLQDPEWRNLRVWEGRMV